MTARNTTAPLAEEITYTGTNALEVQAWAHQHGYVVTGEWPGEAGAPFHLTHETQAEGQRPTAYRVEKGDTVIQGTRGPLIDHPVVDGRPAPRESTSPAKRTYAELDRDDRLRALALQQAVLTFNTPGVSTHDLGGAVRNTAAAFYGFLAGEEKP